MIENSKIYYYEKNQALGNRLFKYCWAREIAEKKGFYFSTSPIVGFPETYNDIPGTKILENEFTTPGNTQIFDMEKLYNHNGKITILGYPQRYEYYAFNKNKITEWLKIENEDDYETPSPNDIVVHIRLGDYVNLGWNLPIEYYQSILQRETYKKCYIITDDPKNTILKEIIADGAIVVDNSKFGQMQTMADFVFAKNAKKIIISPSTFSWWAAFLGNGTVYFPCIKYPWIKNPEKDELDLRVLNQKRYKFIEGL
jgi:hypothetical protein